LLLSSLLDRSPSCLSPVILRLDRFRATSLFLSFSVSIYRADEILDSIEPVDTDSTSDLVDESDLSSESSMLINA